MVSSQTKGFRIVVNVVRLCSQMDGASFESNLEISFSPYLILEKLFMFGTFGP